MTLHSVEFNTGTANDPDNAEAFYRWGKALAAAVHPQAADKRLRNALAINQAKTPRTPADLEHSDRPDAACRSCSWSICQLADLGQGNADYDKRTSPPPSTAILSTQTPTWRICQAAVEGWPRRQRRSGSRMPSRSPRTILTPN